MKSGSTYRAWRRSQWQRLYIWSTIRSSWTITPACESLHTLYYRVSDHKQGYTSSGNDNLHKHDSWRSRLYACDRNEVTACVWEEREGSSCSSRVGSTVGYREPVGFGRSGVWRGCKIGVDAQVPAVPRHPRGTCCRAYLRAHKNELVTNWWVTHSIIIDSS